MIQSICGGQGWGELVLLVVYVALEYWLGKTRHTKAGSILEIVITLVVAFVFLVFSMIKRGNKNE